MELEFSFIASAADLQPDGRFSAIGGGFDTFNVPLLPISVPPFAMLMKFSVSEEERNDAHAFSVSNFTPLGKEEFLLLEAPLKFEKYKPGYRSSTTILIYLSTTFDAAGTYLFKVFADGVLAKTMNCYVNIDESLKAIDVK